jgi:hypothetical protein
MDQQRFVSVARSRRNLSNGPFWRLKFAGHTCEEGYTNAKRHPVGQKNKRQRWPMVEKIKKYKSTIKPFIKLKSEIFFKQ